MVFPLVYHILRCCKERRLVLIRKFGFPSQPSCILLYDNVGYILLSNLIAFNLKVPLIHVY